MKKVLLMLAAAIVAVAVQARATMIDGLNYNLDTEKNTATVTHCLDNDGFNYPGLKGTVTIPSAVTADDVSYTVTAIGTSAFADCDAIESVTIPVTVTVVGNYAFNDCIRLRNISLPAKLSDIGISAFSGTAITEVELSGDITVIKSGTFAGTDLERIKLPSSVETIGEKAFAGCAKLREVVLGTRLVSIGNGAFERCDALATIEFPSSLTSIGERAFKGCKSIAKIDLQDVTSVGKEAFEKCSSLAEIGFGRGALTIGYSAFAECSALQSLTIPATVTEIDQYAFYDCTGLKSVTFEDGDKPLLLGYAPMANAPFTDLYTGRNITASPHDSNPFSSNKSLAHITIGDGVTVIPSRLFSYLPALEDVTFGSGVAEVGSDAFAKCPALAKVKCADVADWAKIDFEDATANPLSSGADLYIGGTPLTALDLAEGASRIGANSFAGYGRLTAITLPASLEEIGQQAFMDCPALEKVTMKGGIVTIGARAFLNCESIAEVYTPSLTAWMANGFATVNSNPLVYGAPLYVGGKLVEDVEVPDGVTAISDFAFAGYSRMTRLTVPAGVTAIGRSAFADCNMLTEIDLGAAVASIGNRAFNGAPLTAITVRNPQPPTISDASTTATFGSYNATVFVPEGSLEAYTDNAAWRLFTDIREKALSGISGAVADDAVSFSVAGTTVTAAGADIIVYDTKGAEVGRLKAGRSLTLDRGVYIVAGGSSRHKLLIR